MKFIRSEHFLFMVFVKELCWENFFELVVESLRWCFSICLIWLLDPSFYSKLSSDTLKESISTVMAGSKEKNRKFTETIELQIGLKNYDPQKDKRFSGSVKLPHIPRPKMKVCMLGDAQHVEEVMMLFCLAGTKKLKEYFLLVPCYIQVSTSLFILSELLYFLMSSRFKCQYFFNLFDGRTDWVVSGAYYYHFELCGCY